MPGKSKKRRRRGHPGRILASSSGISGLGQRVRLGRLLQASLEAPAAEGSRGYNSKLSRMQRKTQDDKEDLNILVIVAGVSMLSCPKKMTISWNRGNDLSLQNWLHDAAEHLAFEMQYFKKAPRSCCCHAENILLSQEYEDIGVHVRILDVVPPSDLAKARPLMTMSPSYADKTHVSQCVGLVIRMPRYTDMQRHVERSRMSARPCRRRHKVRWRARINRTLLNTCTMHWTIHTR